MKICWDNLEKLRYSKKTGKFYRGTSTFIYFEKCPNILIIKTKNFGGNNKWHST